MPWFNFAEVLKWVAPTDFAYLNEKKRVFYNTIFIRLLKKKNFSCVHATI